MRFLKALFPWRSSAFLIGAWLIFASNALAQGGPPMVTDDPDTPGDGRWEVNLAATYGRTAARREIALPDADINYGIGARLQLNVDIPWMLVDDASVGGRKSGVGTGHFGVKWRFVDADDAGFSMSTYPHYLRNVTASSARRGISPEGSSFFLPIEASSALAGFGLDAEIGRNFVRHAGGEWDVGIVASHECTADVECLFEVHRSFAPGVQVTLLNAGTRAKIDERVSFLGSVGREFGGPHDQRRSVTLYLGFQFVR